jgi:cobalt-zinc-cadmium efflux system protein
MTDTHNHINADQKNNKRRLLVALCIVVIFMIVEIAGGVISNSLALVGDAVHMLVDALALGLAFFAITISARPANMEKTFGYYRVEIMTALVNGVILAVVSIFIFYEAYQRIFSPPDIQAPIMLLISVIGLLANLVSMFFLNGAGKGSLNIRAALWHVIGDTISSLGVIAAALIIFFSGWKYADSIIAIIIGCIILWGAVRLVKESVDILLEAVPEHIDTVGLIEAVKQVPGVQDVHDLHIWSITSGINSMSAHIVLQDQMVSNSEPIIKEIGKQLENKFSITHSTLQIECTSCPDGLVCGIANHFKPE